MKKMLSPALAAAMILTLSAAAPSSGIPHFGLASSSPEAGSTVAAPSEVRLTFTQVPQEGTVQIGLVEAEDAGVQVMDAAQDSEDPQVFFIEMHGTLPAGSYTVSWRGMGEDGHVVRDTFEFSVATQ